MKVNSNLVASIDQWLPQTQCTRCGYPRCYAYAEAIAAGEADINQCPPGREVTIRALTNLTDRPFRSPDPQFGKPSPRQFAIIREADCIGCTICIQACPVDAILGSGKMMHTVIQDECTGCELCVPVCPVDCIDMLPPTPQSVKTDSPWPDFSLEQVDRARKRAENRVKRLGPNKPVSAEFVSRQDSVPSAETIRNEIRDAVARVQARQGARRLARHKKNIV